MNGTMKAILITGLVLAAPTAALAQDPGLDRIRGTFPPEAVERIETILADAGAAGVPQQPLLDKALEGAAKGVPADRVVAALSGYSGRLGRARALVGPEAGAPGVIAAADALARGVSPEAIQTLAAQRPDALAIPLVVLGDLLAADVPAQQAFNVLQDALQRSATDDQLLAVPAVVRRLIREGQLPEEAAATVTAVLSDGGLPAIGTAGPGLSPLGAPPVPPGAGPPEEAGPPGGDPPVDPPGPPPGA